MGSIEELQAMKAVLTYESLVRGCSLGKVFSDIVFESVDIESYPPEVRERIGQLEAQMRQVTKPRASDEAR